MKLVKIVSLVMFFACSSAMFILAGSNPAMAEDDDGSLAAKIKMLTDRKWSCYEYFEDFNSLKAGMIWKAGKPSGNQTDFSMVQFEFHQDNTFDETSETGEKLKGKWRFLNNGAKLELTAANGTKTLQVRKLNMSELDWNNDNNEYCVLRSYIPGIDPTHTKIEMITGVMWKFEKYVEDYDEKEGHLVFHVNKYSSDKDMGKYRVQYLNNGTYNEIDPNGQRSSGKWRLINNDTQMEIISDGGTVHTLNILTLTPSLFEFVRAEGKEFGELVPAE